jgi:hypothetical protein
VHPKRSLMKRLTGRTTLLVIATFALFLSVFAAGPANAALGTCGSRAWPEDRLCLMTEGFGAPQVQYVSLHVVTGADGHDYAHAEGRIAPNAWIYLDKSFDGGRTIARGWLNADQNGATGMSSIRTGVTYDGPGYWVRACAVGSDSIFVCTGWN